MSSYGQLVNCAADDQKLFKNRNSNFLQLKETGADCPKINGASEGGGNMKLVAKVEMTIVAGRQPHIVVNGQQQEGNGAGGSTSKSRSPIALHQRQCGGVPMAAEGQDMMPHSTKSLKQQQDSGKKVATGRVGPISLMVRTENGCNGNGRPMVMDISKEKDNGGGEEDEDAGGGTSADGTVEIEQSSTPGTPALVKIKARQVNVRSSEGEIFVVDWYLMQQSKLFLRSWEEHRLAMKKKAGNGRSRKFTFNMDSVESDIFRRVLEWLVEHDGMDDPKISQDPVTGDRIWFELTDFERRFFDQPLDILNGLLIAGKFLDIPSLYMFGCQWMAAMLQEKSPAEIREILDLENDLTSTEIAAIKRRNRKLKMKELKAARYANRLQQLQSQLQQMRIKNGQNASGKGVAEQLMLASGRDILTG